VPALRFAGQLFAASSPENWILFITIPGALIPVILVGSSGDASATALDAIAAWHWPGVLVSDGYTAASADFRLDEVGQLCSDARPRGVDPVLPGSIARRA
jgi:hypothetical protein